jgi:hypothetical protein
MITSVVSLSNALAYYTKTKIVPVEKFYKICPVVCNTKHFRAVIYCVVQKASAFAIVTHFLLALTNTLAFWVTELMTAVISFLTQAPGKPEKESKEREAD